MNNTTTTIETPIDVSAEVFHLKDIPDNWFETYVNLPGERRLIWLADFWEEKDKYTRQPNRCSFTKREIYNRASTQRCLDIYLDSI